MYRPNWGVKGDMQISDRKHVSAVLALVRLAGAGAWYGMGVGVTMLRCSRCRRHKKALCSPRPDVNLVCADCYPLVERELLERSNQS
jgi:hypothetical protein